MVHRVANAAQMGMCRALNEEFLNLAQQNDPAGVIACRHRFGGPAITIWHYLCHKLKMGLDQWRRQGEAGWAWRTPGRLVCGIMWCSGSQESQSCSTLDEVSCVERWWPIVFRDVPGEKKPTYCPALAWQHARPWMGHESRLFEIFAAGDLGHLPTELPGPVAVLPMLTMGPAHAVVPPPPLPLPASTVHAVVPPPPPPLPATIGSPASASSTKPAVEDAPASAISDAGTTRTRRWGNRSSRSGSSSSSSGSSSSSWLRLGH